MGKHVQGKHAGKRYSRSSSKRNGQRADSVKAGDELGEG